MLKYIKNHMTSIDGIEIYPIISLVIFTVFFGIIIWKVFSLRKSEIKKLENTPFD
ncbi:MAG: CcoQ/FixQ family Cbb3-type cytochrome c oxidase assembly chaperone [Flavobacteriales bacterium]